MTSERPFQPTAYALPPFPLDQEQETFRQSIDHLCDVEPLTVTSYWRSPEQNSQAGGAANSLHLSALAADLDEFGVDLDRYIQLTEWLNEMGIAVLVYYDENRSYIHAQARPLLSGSMLSVKT